MLHFTSHPTRSYFRSEIQLFKELPSFTSMYVFVSLARMCEVIHSAVLQPIGFTINFMARTGPTWDRSLIERLIL